VKAWVAPEFSSFYVGGPSSLALSDGAISYMGCMVPPVICYWRDLIVSRILGHNLQPTIPRVLDLDHTRVLIWRVVKRICNVLLGPPPGRVRLPTVWTRSPDNLGQSWLHSGRRTLSRRPYGLRLREFRTWCWTTSTGHLLWQRDCPRWGSFSRAGSMLRLLSGSIGGPGLRWLPSCHIF
jgi:hypothetical protein